MGLEAVLEALQNGGVEAAIAAISVTPDREKRGAFSHPYFFSGLGVAVSATRRGGQLAAIVDELRKAARCASGSIGRCCDCAASLGGTSSSSAISVARGGSCERKLPVHDRESSRKPVTRQRYPLPEPTGPDLGLRPPNAGPLLGA